ncbi:unnamed protein product [Somion occarium]|uniref:Uncharacterized protein n=1 Tax=Somion occarium TaxID=3059160 RepID=A0ABP1CQX0_9APHY
MVKTDDIGLCWVKTLEIMSHANPQCARMLQGLMMLQFLSPGGARYHTGKVEDQDESRGNVYRPQTFHIGCQSPTLRPERATMGPPDRAVRWGNSMEHQSGIQKGLPRRICCRSSYRKCIQLPPQLLSAGGRNLRSQEKEECERVPALQENIRAR